jgi:hypothetical protein
VKLLTSNGRPLKVSTPFIIHTILPPYTEKGRKTGEGTKEEEKV